MAEISPNDVTTSSTGNAFSYDIQATISGSDTGVNRVAITAPGSFGAPTVTGVQVNGSGVAYTDNTAGNAISVDLTTKATASSKITVLFSANAPTTQDLTGVNFTSTVDDSGTADVAAQATTQGNGDGDVGDNNSWKSNHDQWRRWRLPDQRVHRRRKRRRRAKNSLEGRWTFQAVIWS